MSVKNEIIFPDATMLYRKYTTPNVAHKHVLWELEILEKGETDIVVNGKHFDACRGDVFLLGPKHVHEINFRSDTHLHGDFYFSDEEVKYACDSIDDDLWDKVRKNELLVSFRLSSAALEAVLKAGDNLRLLSELAQNSKGLNFDKLKNVSRSVLIFVLGIYKTEELVTKPAFPQWFLNLLENLDNPEVFTLPPNEIIATTYYSHATVSKTFMKCLGVTLAEYLIDRRLNYATELLQNTSYSVLDVCSRAGYDSLSYFIKIFKRKYGVTPNKYRSKILSLPAKSAAR